MKRVILFSIFVLSCIAFNSCKDDNNPSEEGPEYKVQIMSPDATDKHVGDSIHFHINFESMTNQTIHHINVKIYNKDAPSEIVYDLPMEAHLHDEDGYYEYHDDFALSNINGISEHTDWVLEAKVWGHSSGLEEVIETVEFHVHP